MIKTVILAVLLFSVILVSCQSSQPDTYATYNQPQQQQNQYVGGGCGVAPESDYSEPIQEVAGTAL